MDEKEIKNVFSSIDSFRRYAIGMAFFTVVYFIWLFWAPKTPLGYVFLILEIIMHAMVFLFVVTNWNREYKLRGGSYSMRVPVDVYIPTINEPLDMLKRTISHALEIEHPNTHIYVLDDGDRPKLKKLCEKMGVNYLTRGKEAVEEKPYKAANMNYAFKRSFGLYILALDADHIISPTVFDDLLGHFNDKHVGYITTKQHFQVPEDDFNHDYLFYEYMQAGKASFGSPVSTGSGVMYRRKALEKIGGFQEWNIVEDLYTSIRLNEVGYNGVYVAQAYSLGTAPSRLKNIYKQRGTWAQDGLRLIFYRNPLFNRKLNLMQRLAYFELGYIYFVGALFIPGIFFLDMYALLLDEPILKVGLSYLLFKLPSFVFILFVYNSLSRGVSSTSMWTALSPVYLRSVFRALLYVKPRYKPTVKRERKKNGLSELIYVWPHIFLVWGLTFALTYNYLTYGLSLFLSVKFSWIIILLLLMFPIFPRVFDLNKKQTNRALVFTALSFVVIFGAVFAYGFVGLDVRFAELVYEYVYAPLVSVTRSDLLL